MENEIINNVQQDEVIVKEKNVYVIIAVTFIITLLLSVAIFIFLNKQQKTDYQNQITNINKELVALKNTVKSEAKIVSDKEEEKNEVTEISNNIEPQTTKSKTDNLLDTSNCTTSNPPRIEDMKFGQAINICGNKTKYKAYEFEDEKDIIFVESIWDSEKKIHNETLKRISTEAPFNIEDLGKIISAGLLQQKPVYLETENLYFWGVFADGPGSLEKVFIYSPSDKKYLSYLNNTKGYVAPTTLKIISSESDDDFFAEINPRLSPFEEGELLGEDDTELIINNKSYTKSEVDNSKNNLKDLFKCKMVYFTSEEFSDNIEGEKIKVTKYASYFPNKLPCFTDSDGDDISGYFSFNDDSIIFEVAE